MNIEENSYQTNQKKISGIAFITENGKINIKEFYKLSPKTYLEEKEVDAIIKSMIDESLNENHKRARKIIDVMEQVLRSNVIK